MCIFNNNKSSKTFSEKETFHDRQLKYRFLKKTGNVKGIKKVCTFVTSHLYIQDMRRIVCSAIEARGNWLLKFKV